MSMITSIINNKIKERGTTIAFISRKTKIKPDILSKTLNGNRNLRADEFVILCQVLNLELEDFVGCRLQSNVHNPPA